MDTPVNRLGLDVLERDDLRRALEEHDFAAAFALIKKWGGLSQNKIATSCELTPGKVSHVISGQHQITSMAVVRRIADGLGIPGALLGLAPRPWEKQAQEPMPPPTEDCRPSEEVPWHPHAAVGLADHLTRSDLVLNRRAATRALSATAVTGAALLDTLEGWLQPAGADSHTRRHGRLGTRDLDDLETTARTFRAWDHQYGGGLRRKAVLGQLNEVASALDEHQSPAVEQRLYGVMAQLAGTAATMAWDLGHQRRAQDYYLVALRSAHAAGDTAFGANVLAGMARQMLYVGRHQDALELVRLAQDGVRTTAGPRLRAMLHTREAWAYAAMGRHAAFRRASGQAGEALSTAGPDEPYWINYFDTAELAGVTGGRLLDLARQDPRRHAPTAAQEIRTALDQRGPEASRSHALDWIGLAECHFLVGDITGAVESTHHAVGAAARTRSGRVRSQLAQLYPYTVGRDATGPLREARDRIRELLAT
ncbi:helix-turn-helix transcriptional regulator [Streptomyces sp. DSM 41527]|uniref:Helix-turn-helix transcriptional regulator n=1 Tax=Streptomyces mooreae TaxID=3075523 RepID=A0ABU2TFB4_9ACTN|nr:helix-turn-helix transcriptional regulator [Streptomyces sp. DSM 41527]MDT0459633.1 helix-turn-helix transcriptional regulator [Streptomyces sp. DSM 41527]